MATTRQDLFRLLDALEQRLPALLDLYPIRSRDFAIAFRREVARIAGYAGAADRGFLQTRLASILGLRGVSPVELEARCAGTVRLWSATLATVLALGDAMLSNLDAVSALRVVA